MTTFRNPNDPNNTIITAKIQEWVKSELNLSEDTSIQVLEVDCADVGCVDKETRITLSLNNNFVKQYRIHKPIVYVRKLDIDHLIKNL